MKYVTFPFIQFSKSKSKHHFLVFILFILDANIQNVFRYFILFSKQDFFNEIYISFFLNEKKEERIQKERKITQSERHKLFWSNDQNRN